MFERLVLRFFAAALLVLPACGAGDGDGQDDIPAAEVQASDPEIPAEPGHLNGDWSASDDSFTFSVGEGQFEPPAGGTYGPGAIFNYGQSSSASVSAGGQLNIRWENPDEAAGDDDPSSVSLAVNYGLSGEFTLEPGSYEVAPEQTSDGMPWLNGSNDPKLRYSSADRRLGDRTNGLLVIEEVTDTNMTGRLIVTGGFLSKDGTFRLAVAFNAYRD
jgi:hypothetical protein